MKPLLLIMTGLLLAIARLESQEEAAGWDQEKARATFAKVLELERQRGLPWNKIKWRTNAKEAALEARRTGKPLFVFFYSTHQGPPVEPCCPNGRLLRSLSLADSTVIALVNRNFIPLKAPFEKDQGFPLLWPALENWATTCKFSNERGFAGCAVVSTDLEVEYGNSGSAMIWELFESPAFDPKRFAVMLRRSLERLNEERALAHQRGIKSHERAAEVQRFRRQIGAAVAREGRRQLPPDGYSLEKAMELFRMAGAVE